MTQTMYDALNVAGIPADTPLNVIIASYVDHPEYPWSLCEDRFPNHRKVTISAHGKAVAQCYDVENGAMTPDMVPGMLLESRYAGITPWVYATMSNWSLVVSACHRAGVAVPLWWLAHWGQPAQVPPGTIGIQYDGRPGIDYSVMIDDIPGFDTKDDDMDINDFQAWSAVFFSPSPRPGVAHSGEGYGRIRAAVASILDPGALAAAVAAKLPQGQPITTQQLEDALTAVLGSLDGS